MLNLLGRSNSINVRKVLWTLDERKLAFKNGQGAGDDPHGANGQRRP